MKKIYILLGGAVFMVGSVITVIELFSLVVRPISFGMRIGGREFSGIDIGLSGRFLLVIMGILMLVLAQALSEGTASRIR